jgi:serine/threonine protein kinase
MAPEVISGIEYDEKADVYSYGVLLWELMYSELPYDGMSEKKIMEEVVKGFRPCLDKEVAGAPQAQVHDLKRMIGECWHSDPGKRPHLVDVVGRLGGIEAMT